MCRMCLVEIDTGRGPALQPSCMIPVSDGMTVVTDSDTAKKAQSGVLEFLLANHPLDCPVCDKGGECPLQDQAYSHGPGESRFVEEKRHFEKPIPISDLVELDRERCILCDRCTRFADEVAGDPLIHFIDRGSQTQVNTFPDHPFASYFWGNTVQICPVGALTAEPYRFKARPWDLDQVESTCTSCSVGCRVAVQASRNQILRYQGVDIDAVNWGWLCDKGRFDFQAVHAEDRLAQPLLRDDGGHAPATWSTALGRAAEALSGALERSGPAGIGVVGGARLTNESAYAWAKLAKGVLGTDNVDCQLGDGLPADAVLGLPRATIDDACRPGGTILLVGVDPKEELPVLYLRLRHAVVEDGVTLVELVPHGTGLSSLATHSLRPRTGRRRRRRRPAGGRLAGRRRRRHRQRHRGGRRGATRLDRSRSSSVAATSPTGPSSPLPRPARFETVSTTSGSCPVCGGATSTAPSTRAWRRASCPAGWPSTPVAPTSTSTGPPFPPTGASTPRASSRPPPTASSTSSSCSAPIRWPTSPTTTSPDAPSPAPARSSPSATSSPSRCCRPTSCCPPRATPRSTAPPPTSRAASARLHQKVTPAGHRPPRLDHRRRAGPAPGRRPRPRVGGRHLRRGRRVAPSHRGLTR